MKKKKTVNIRKYIIMLTGGARSGKSGHALELAGKYQRRVFIATGTPLDEEMAERIKRHRSKRGSSFHTVEEPTDLAGAIRSLPAGTEVAVIDCLTTWLGNLMHSHIVPSDPFPEVKAFLDVLKNPPCSLIIVTNEVGMGIVPDNAMARRFRDMAGRLNAMTAQSTDEVVLLVSGIPVVIREATYEQARHNSQTHRPRGPGARAGHPGAS